MYLKVKVNPGARRESVERVGPDAFAVSVREKPRDNAANRRVCEVMAAALGVPVGRVRIVRGHHAHSKIIEVPDLS
ncbi:MAG: DUF167 domain-containing protein [Rhodospirillaceae bacterium]|nr:DUF167 domain-containing protein [Rhodospirillaceae bacterium]